MMRRDCPGQPAIRAQFARLMRVSTWNVVPTSLDFEPTSETAGAFSISFDSDNALVDSAFREI